MTPANGTIRVATWNLQWAPPTGDTARAVLARLAEVDADVAVLTEARLPLLEGWEFIAHAPTGVWPGTPADGSKVVIASHHRLDRVDDVGHEDLPPGNFVAADVMTGRGPLRIIGVVVRYRAKTAFVEALPRALSANASLHTVLAGDFNLPIPGGPLSTRLTDVLTSSGLRVVTSGPYGALDDERPLIDHIAVSSALETSGDVVVWPRVDHRYRDGTRELTDHAGAAVDVVLPV